MNQSQPQSLALLFPEIKELLNAQNFTLLKQVLRECDVIGFTDVWRRFSEDERLQVFKLLPTGSALKLFEVLDVADQKFLLKSLSEENVTPLLENMDSPDLAKIFHKMSPRAVKKMTGLIRRQEALAHIDKLMQYPEDSAGALMHPEFVKLLPRHTAKQAMSILSAIARPNQREHLVSALFVTDEEGRLMGMLHLHDLFRAPEDEKLAEVMESTEAIKIFPETSQDEVSKLFSKYQLQAAPVVDSSGKLLGVIEVGDIISVVKQEATEDIQKMGAMQVLEEPYLRIGFFQMFKKRGVWLAVLFLGEMLTASAMAHFEEEIARAVVLALFVPLIISSGGNSGSQASTLVIRAMALGEVKLRDWWKIVYRELGMGLALGTSLALIGFFRIIAWQAAFGIYGEHYVLIGACVAISLLGVVMFGTVCGSALPLLLQRLRLDPASASAPFVATLVDVSGILIYFSVSALLLRGTLL